MTGFNKRSTALEVVKDMDLSGKTFLITGANTGIGRSIMHKTVLIVYFIAYDVFTIIKLSSKADDIHLKENQVDVRLVT